MITTKRKYEDLYEFSYKMRKRFLEIFTTVGFGHVTFFHDGNSCRII